MKLGFSLPMAGAWATPDNQVLVAQRAETLGYHSLWVFQRLLYALEPKGDYPPLPGQPRPKAFQRVMDPTVWGTLDEIREDVQRYAAEGLTELFLEANFDPRGPSLEPALRVMEALAPAGTGF